MIHLSSMENEIHKILLNTNTRVAQIFHARLSEDAEHWSRIFLYVEKRTRENKRKGKEEKK